MKEGSSTAARALSALAWEHSFVAALPGDVEKRNFARQVAGAAYSEVAPTPVREPQLLGWSEPLATSLGITFPSASDLAILAGNAQAQNMRPHAARYGGHQFGHWAGQLGDGRAISLGEALCADGTRWEFQLKGPGKTPYSRTADGRAVLRSSLREFLCSEAMHHLGVPTTRALALVGTGEQVVRDMLYDGNPRPEPGAIVCRVAPSFVRFGSFEILAAKGETSLLQDLFLYVLRNHFPEIDSQAPNAPARFFDCVCRRTATLMVDWMRVGFVHGVMNTDNMSMLGLTIDYGPYGWLEPYEPGWTPNTTDERERRYRYGQQPQVAHWNLACLAGALAPLVADEDLLQAGLETYAREFQSEFETMLARKLGLDGLSGESDTHLVQRLLALLQRTETDYTLFFRGLAGWWQGASVEDVLAPALYNETALARDGSLREDWTAWFASYNARAQSDGKESLARARAMNAVNPKYVLRNYLAQNAIVAAEKGDLSIMERLLRVLRQPYNEQPDETDLCARRPDWARNTPGCSALSCSS